MTFRCIFRLLTPILIALMLHAADDACAQDKKTVIATIRKETMAINTDHTLKPVVLNNDEFIEQVTDGGGSLTGYYKGGQLKKIVCWVGLSNGNEVMEYYFKDNRLLFVYERFSSFVYDSKNDLLRHDSTETTFEGRYYFANDKLIDYVTTGHNRFENKANDPELLLTKEAYDYRRKLVQKRKPGIKRP